MSVSDSEPRGPLRGLRVVDLTLMLSGPFCTMLLADLGADVVKVEPPSGDITRRAGPFRADDTTRAFGGYFHSVNRNKRSVVIDLKAERGRELLKRLVADADVLVENFRPQVMDRLGLAYERLREQNLRLVYGSIRGFGDPRTGESPYAAWPAFDVTAQGMGGPKFTCWSVRRSSGSPLRLSLEKYSAKSPSEPPDSAVEKFVFCANSSSAGIPRL